MNFNKLWPQIRYSFAILGLLLFAASCKLPMMGRLDSTRPKPQVELNNGNVVSGENVYRTRGIFEGNKIVKDNEEYPSKDVRSYSDGSETFVRVRRTAFAQKIVDGQINVYKEELPYFTFRNCFPVRLRINGMQQRSVRFYIEDNNGKKLSYLNYKNLSPLVPKGTPAAKMLDNYAMTNHITWLTGIVGVGMYTAGFVTFVNGAIDNNYRNANVGAAMLFTGLGVGIASIIVNNMNHLKLCKVIGMVNGVPVR